MGGLGRGRRRGEGQLHVAGSEDSPGQTPALMRHMPPRMPQEVDCFKEAGPQGLTRFIS